MVLTVNSRRSGRLARCARREWLHSHSGQE